MSTVEVRARLGAPLGTIYDALQDASALPYLLDGVADARNLPHATLLMTTYGGQSRAWEVQVVDAAEGRHITWDRTDGPGSAEVRLRPAGPRGTDVTVLVFDVEDAASCQRILEAELAHLDQTVQALEQRALVCWGVGGPW